MGVCYLWCDCMVLVECERKGCDCVCDLYFFISFFDILYCYKECKFDYEVG